MRTVIEVATFVGPLSFVWDDDALGVDAEGRVIKGAVVRSEFVRAARLAGAGARVVDADSASGDPGMVVQAVRAWSDGSAPNALDVVPVLQAGGEFRQKCWQALRSVKAGEVLSYAELAQLAGNPLASRAAGSAMASNTVAPFVPCHRVVRADGVIGNYSATGGSETKVRILEHEGNQIA
ncbi:MAG: methylated-DNA--[protein]-cysteine S-methyltransferase [Candidatus Nanopelagicales bacterium]